MIDRKAGEEKAAGATWRTKVRALHRTTIVVFLTDTLMRRTTRPITRAMLLRKRLSGFITGNTTKRTRMLNRADHRWTRRGIRLRWVVLLLAGHHHHHRTSTRRGQVFLWVLLLWRRRRRRPHQPRNQYRSRKVTDHHHRACQTHQTAAVPQGTLLRGIRRLSGDRARGCE